MEPSRARIDSGLRWTAIAGLVACAGWVAFRLIDGAGAPGRYDGYRYRNAEPADWAYPTGDVAGTIALFAFEVVVASVILRRARSTAGACFLLALSCGVIGFFAGIFSIHAPLPYGLHVVLLFLAGAWLLVMAVVSGVTALATRDRRGDTTVAAAPGADAPPGPAAD